MASSAIVEDTAASSAVVDDESENMATFPEDPINVHQMGQQVTLSVDFKDVAAVAADPDTVLLRIVEGDEAGTVTDVLQASLDNPSVGRWEHQLLTPKNGDKAIKPWTYRFEGDSADKTSVNASDERRFELAPSPLYPPST